MRNLTAYLIGGFIAGLNGGVVNWEKGASAGQPNPSQWLPFGPQGRLDSSWLLPPKTGGDSIIPPPGASW